MLLSNSEKELASCKFVLFGAEFIPQFGHQ